MLAARPPPPPAARPRKLRAHAPSPPSPLPSRRLSAPLLAARADKALEAQLRAARLRYLQLMHAVRDVERTIRAKEQLAEGLHLIDFEQLKIENTNLNEKIEERNEDLAKLRRKINTTVQILTHVREKLQFVARDNAALQARLDEDAAALSSERDALLKLKAERDAVRGRSTRIQATSTFVTAPPLLEDLRKQKDLKDDLSIEIGGLRKRWEETKERNERMTQRLAAGLSGSLPASPSTRSLAGKASHRSQPGDTARTKDANAIMGAPSAASLVSPLASPKAVRFNA